MGLSFHYKGRIKAKELLSSLIEEVREIAEVHNWRYQILDEEFTGKTFGTKKFDDSLCGIIFTPPECETVSVVFLSNGTLCFPYALNYFQETGKKDLFYGVSVKTQFAGPSIHIFLVHLFDYLSKKYFDDFEFTDEGEYWETWDEKILKEKFAFLTSMINRVGQIVKTVKLGEGESIEDYFQNLIRKLNEENFDGPGDH